MTDPETGQLLEFRTRKARCLIGLVALSPGAAMNREKLASFLWDPAPEDQARTSLRQCLKEIREILGNAADSVITADRLTVSIQLQNIEIDALAIFDQIATAKTNRDIALTVARLWRGELFGDAIPPAPVFEAWVQIERSRLRTMVSNLITDHLENLIRSGDYGNADLAEELVRIEPSHELAHQFLMKYYALRGDQAGAIRQYTRLNQTLADELDSEPSQESIELLVAIKQGSVAPSKEMVQLPATAAAHPQATRSGLPKIAIRPPLSRHNDESKEYLADGFANLTRVCLSKFRCWIILSWPSTGFDSKVKIDFPALGNAIGADYVVDTALDWRHQPGRLFVSLVDCRDGSQVWSDIFPIAETELQSMSSSVSGIIAAKLASQINQIVLLRYARSAPGDAVAYDLWLKGHQLSKAWSPASDAEARSLFQTSIELDPALACAYASLASILNTQSMTRPGYKDDADDKRQAFELAQKALTLDPFDSRNHYNLAWSWLLANSAERAESHFRLAVDLNPYDSETLIACAMGMAFLGQLDLAKQWSDLAVSLNPLHPEYFLGYLAMIRYLSGDSSAAVKLGALCRDVFPDMEAWNAAAHAALGDAEQASAAMLHFQQAILKKWEGLTPPSWEELLDWLLRTVPIIWPAGRGELKKDLAKAHAFAKDRSKIRLA